MKTPDQVNFLQLECTCVHIGANKWNKLMENATVANSYKINKLVKEHLPDLFADLMLDSKSLKDLRWFNPYTYYKTENHLILVHSSIEYFLRYEE